MYHIFSKTRKTSDNEGKIHLFSDWFRKQQMAGKTHLQSVGAFSKLGDARLCSHHLMSIHIDLVFNAIWFSEVLIVIIE